MNPTKDSSKQLCNRNSEEKASKVPLPSDPEGKLVELPIQAVGAESCPINLENTIRIGLLPKEFKQHRKLVDTQRDLCKKLVDKIVAAQETPDLVVCIGHSKFKVHSAIMSTYSDLFAYRYAGQKVVVLPDDCVPPQIFKTIYQWMCRKDVTIAKDDLNKMILAADYLRIGFLILNLKPYIDIM